MTEGTDLDVIGRGGRTGVGDALAQEPQHAQEAPVNPVNPEPDEDGLSPAPVCVAPRTGDAAVDEALADLEQGARDDDLDAQVAAGERAHRELQARLDDLGTA